jgi:hypothetical protein
MRRRVLKRANGMCECCKQLPAEHIHHIHYENRGREKETDLLAVCLLCHGKFHPTQKFMPLEVQRERAKKRRRNKAKKRAKTAKARRELERGKPSFETLAELAQERTKREGSVTATSRRRAAAGKSQRVVDASVRADTTKTTEAASLAKTQRKGDVRT